MLSVHMSQCCTNNQTGGFGQDPASAEESGPSVVADGWPSPAAGRVSSAAI